MSKKIITRDEAWGRIIYDLCDDEFSAEVLQRRMPLPGSPIGIGWIIIGGCNLKCIHCYGNAEALPKTILSTSECMRIVERIIEAKVMRVVISGGEPMLRDDIFQVIHRFYEKGVSVVLGTNGSFVERSNVKQLRECTRVEISLDSATAEINNRIRPSRQKRGNAWHETMRAIRLCMKHGVRLRVLTTVNSWNQNQIVEMADLLEGMGVKDWALSWTMPAGRALAVIDDLRPQRSTVEQNLERARESHRSLAIRYSNRASDFNRFYCLILPDGQMATEDMVLGRKLMFGSVLEHAITSLWSAENFNLSQHFTKWVGDRIRSI